MDCFETPGLCGFFNAPKVPAFRYIAYNTTAWTGKQIRFDDGEDLLDYLNKQMGMIMKLCLIGRYLLCQWR